VFTLRCTKKLLARLGSTTVTDEVGPTTRLGDWYANLISGRAGRSSSS
jgi:hypothetical protein